MSKENVELVRRISDEWSLGEISEANIRWAYHPDVEFLPLRAATEGAYRGIAGIERFVADTPEVFEKFEPRFELRDLGERVLAWGAIHVRARQSGIDTEISMGGVFEFRDGKIVRWQDFGSKDEALKAVGLAE
jgi:ketosteroid isomerase-like protein